MSFSQCTEGQLNMPRWKWENVSVEVCYDKWITRKLMKEIPVSVEIGKKKKKEFLTEN